MVDVRGDVLRPPHGTTPAAVKSNKNQSIFRNPFSRTVVTLRNLIATSDVRIAIRILEYMDLVQPRNSSSAS